MTKDEKMNLKNLMVFIFCLFSLFVFSSIPSLAANDLVAAKDFRQRALVSQKAGNYNEAYFYYIRAVAFDNTSADLFNETGLMAEASGRGGEAESYYRSAIEVDQGFLPAYYNLGILFLSQKKYILAEQYLKQRVARGAAADPWTLRAQERLEEVYDLCPELHQGEVAQMAQDFEKDLFRQKIIERQNVETRKLMDIEEIYHNGVISYDDGDFWLAVNLFEEVLALDPDRKDVKNALERARERMRRQNAVRELDVSVEKHKPAIMEMYLSEAESN